MFGRTKNIGNPVQILIKSNGRALKKVIELGRENALIKIKESGLRGRGGANFPTWQKWKLVRDQTEKEKYLICNADEGEPGSFKDKFIIQNNPNNIIEGILIAFYIIGITKSFIYLRNEYSCLKKDLELAIKRLKAENKIHIIIGAGSYVCGDETALISSIEGKRPCPNEKPPFPTEKGLFGKPTLINNLETLANIPLIFITKFDSSLRLFSLSGNITKPGIYELREGINLKKLVKIGQPKNKPKSVYFGAAGGMISYKSVKLSDEKLRKYNCFLGSASVIVVDKTKGILNMALNLAKFFEYESCGKCTPCREGTRHILEILEKVSLGNGTEEDLQILNDLIFITKNTSICGLGKTSSLHLENTLKYFKEEIRNELKN